MVIALTTQNASYMFSFFFLVDSTFWPIFLSFILKYIFKPVLRSAFILCDLYFQIKSMVLIHTFKAANWATMVAGEN